MVTRSHKLRSRLLMLLAIPLILLAVAFSMFRMLAPHVADYTDKIQAELTQSLGVPVDIGMMSVDIWRLLPQLKLMDVSVYDQTGQRHLIHFDEVMVGLDWSGSLFQWRPVLGHIVLNGWNLQIKHDYEGQWIVQGITLPKTEGPFELPPDIEALLVDTEIYLENGELDWEDMQHSGQRLVLSDIQLALINSAPRHQLSLDVNLPMNYGQHIQIKADMRGPILQPDQWQGQAYVSLNKMQVKRFMNDYWQYFDFAAEGELDADVWLNWDHLTIDQMHVFVNGNGMAMHYLKDDVRTWKLDHIIGTARWQKQDSGWQADISGLQIQRDQNTWLQPATMSINLDEQKKFLTAQASYLRVGDLVYLGGLIQTFLPEYLTQWNDPVQAWQPRGDVYDFALELPLQNPQALTAQARFVDASYKSQNAVPSASGLDGEVRYVQEKAEVNLNSKNMTLDFGKLFRQPLQISQLLGTVKFDHMPGYWQLYANELYVASPYIATTNRVWVVIPEEGQVFMDLSSRIAQGKAQYTSLYLPTDIMNKNTVAWLDRAIGKGDIVQGGVVFHGNLHDFPFSHGEGMFQVLFDVDNLNLDYYEKWPVINDLAARVEFINRSMSIEHAHGNIYGAVLQNTRVSIEDFGQAQLDIHGEATGNITDFLRFVASSPLHEPLAYVSEMRASGKADLKLELAIPLTGDAHTQVNGNLKFENNTLQLPELSYKFTNMNGELDFTESGFSSNGMRVMLEGYPLDLRIVPEMIDGVNHSRISAQGNVAASVIATPLPILQNKLSGVGSWIVNVDVPMSAREDNVVTSVNVTSDLQGIRSDLPFNLRKTEKESGVFNLKLAVLSNNGMDLNVDYADQYHVRGEKRQDWWTISADSDSLRGQVRFKQGFSVDDTVTANIDFVDWAAMSTEESDKKKTSVEEDEQGLLPREIPPLNIHIARMNWENVVLHDVKLQTRHSALGMLIDSIDAQGPNISLKGSGNWLSSWRNPHATSLDFTLSTDNLGSALNQMAGIKAIDKTKGEAKVHWQWNAQPYKFDWSLVTGDADIKLKDGRLKDVESGAGRVLGFLNFRTLLSLDFGSQFGEGFAFDDMTGRIRFDEGNAYTDDFQILGKAANVHLKGRIGLVAEDYDQAITVIPGVGNTLTLIGTVAIGPAAGVVVHLLQKLIGVDKIAKYQYTVKGNWDKPKVKLIDAPQNAGKAAE